MHPLAVFLYFLPVCAVAAWSRTVWAAWGLAILAIALMGVDAAALWETLGQPNTDYKGCTACMGPLLLRVFSAPVWLVLLVIGACIMLRQSLEEER